MSSRVTIRTTARRSWTSLGVLAATATALLALAPAASADVRSGSGTDPVDRPVPGRDIASASIDYDSTGIVRGVVTLAGAPTTASGGQLGLALGTRDGDGVCQVGSAQGGGGVDVLLDPASSAVRGTAGADTFTQGITRAENGATVTISATNGVLANRPWNCATAAIGVSSGGELIIEDLIDPFFDLVGAAPPAPPAPPAPAPPAPQPPPAPAPVAPAPQPKPRTPRIKKLPKLPKLTVSVTGVPKVAKRKRWFTARVRVANTGRATAKRVRLKVGKVRGVSAKLPRTTSWKTLKAGARKTIKVRLRRTATRSRTVRLTATGRAKLKATASITLLDKAPRVKKPKKGAPAPPAAKGPLAGRYFWGSVNHVDYSWDNRGVYFVDDHWAYFGLPAGGLPTCTQTTAETDSTGQPTGDGCVPYTYDPGSGSLTVGPHQGTFTGGGLKLDDVSMSPLSIPAPGSRYQVDLIHRSFQGLCGMLSGCTTSAEYLTMTNDGQFSRSRSSLSTLGDGFATPFVAVGSYPPDQHGTYEILKGGRIQLSFADGTVKVETIGIDQNAAGVDDPVNEGLLLDDTNFYTESD